MSGAGPLRGPSRAIVIGAGPAGLMAAEQLAARGYPVDVYDAMASVGRKFLRAGIGGLNLTHTEPLTHFRKRYSDPGAVTRWLNALDPDGVRRWAADLGIATFTGSSGRVFPVGMKAAPLLRAWLQRLRSAGVTIHTRHRWRGWGPAGAYLFETAAGLVTRPGDVAVFALGGGSWARLGSDGEWLPAFIAAGIDCALLRPANCGFGYAWSAFFGDRYAGAPVKPLALTVAAADGSMWTRKGEIMISGKGLEGGLLYAASAVLRDEIERRGAAVVHWDLLPDTPLEQVAAALSQPRGKQSLSTLLRKRLGLSGVKNALLRELAPGGTMPGSNWRDDSVRLAELVKRLPQRLSSPSPIDEAISTAGGVRLDALDDHLMVRSRPGVFCAGEMLDWEAPTGGYLLTACLASGVVAGRGAADYLSEKG